MNQASANFGVDLIEIGVPVTLTGVDLRVIAEVVAIEGIDQPTIAVRGGPL